MAVSLHTALGDDQPGQRVRERLAREGLALIIDAAVPVASAELASSDLAPTRVESEYRRRFGAAQ